jgi:hypothetical protein
MNQINAPKATINQPTHTGHGVSIRDNERTKNEAKRVSGSREMTYHHGWVVIRTTTTDYDFDLSEILLLTNVLYEVYVCPVLEST